MEQSKFPALDPVELTFNDTKLTCPIQDGHLMIPLKTVCEIIDVQFKVQDSWLKKHPFFSQLYRLDGTVGADKKQRKMNCLSIFDLYSWLSSISDNKRRKGSIDKQYAFMTFIREKMIEGYQSVQHVKKANEHELKLVSLKEQTEEELLKAKTVVKELQSKVKDIDKSIEEIRVNRITGQVSMNFPAQEERA